MKHSIESWKDYTLGEVAEFINGRAFKTTEWEDMGRRIIRIQDLTGKINDPHFTTKIFDSKYLVKKNDLLISWSATLDAFIWNDEDGWLNQHIFKVKENPQLISKKFLYYLIKKEIDLIRRQIHGSTMKHITKARFTSIRIHLPSIQVQNEIVKIIEKVDQLKQWRKESDQLTDDYLSGSLFLKMFGDPKKNPKHWSITRIKDVIEYSQYGTSVKSNSYGRGYPIIGMSNITYDGHLDLSEYSYVELPKEEFEKLKLHKGDVIFNRTNSTELVGKTTYWNLDLEAVLASYLVKLKLKERVNPIFFTYLMNTRFFKKLFSIRCKKAVNQSNISPTLLKEFNMYLPPIELQNGFAATVKKVEQLKAHQKRSQQQIDDFFNMLIQKAFRGELTC